MADGDEHESDLTRRMRHRYMVATDYGACTLNVYTLMAALAEEVRAYDAEQQRSTGWTAEGIY